MGKSVKLPSHLYLSPPAPQPPSSSFTATAATAASLLFFKSASLPSPAALIQETSSSAFAVGDKIPGFKTSTTFLTTLRANINLDVDAPDSLATTPNSLRPIDMTSSTSSLPGAPLTQDSDFAPPSALTLPKAHVAEDEDDAPAADAARNEDPDYIPPLGTLTITDTDEQIAALKLVADSVAQQRQQASKILIFHPATFAILVAILAIIYQWLFAGETGDYYVVGTTFVAVVMCVLVSIRAAAGGYLEEAERVGTWKWLHKGLTKKDEEETGKRAVVENGTDTFLVTKYGDEIIGAVIFRGVQPVSEETSPKKKGGRKSNGKDGQIGTEIRAWTVRTKYRGHEVGGALLQDAIRIAHEKGWANGGIYFASDHANHKRVLPKIFNAPFDRDEARARAYLERAVARYEGEKGKKGKKR